jgi:asparagine synthase (glutamine-hydrolysing)
MRRAAGERAAGSWIVEVNPDERSAQPFRLLADLAETPATSTRESSTLVFEGQLYNRAELAALARLEGSASSDADLLRSGYDRLGEALVRRMKGIFALVVWDGQSRTLLAVRDPLGVVPLFYASTGATLLLSTSLEELLRRPGVSRLPNRLSLAGQLLELWPESNETAFEAVKRVPPGHLMSWRGRKRKLSRYWDPAEGAEEAPASAEESLERFEALLAQAVDRCLESGRAGVWLSGGLDSATVAAAAAERSRKKGLPAPWVLSLLFPHPSVNEEETQRRVAASLDLPQVLLPFERAVGSSGFLVASLEAAARSSTPSVNLWRPAYTALMDEGIRRGCAVILTGEGGDEWLAPPPSYAADRLAVLDLASLYRIWQARWRAAPLPPATTLRTVLWVWAAHPLLRQAAGVVLDAWSPSATRAYRLRNVFKSLPPWLAPDPDLRRAMVEVVVDALPKPAPRALYQQTKRRLASNALLGLAREEWFEEGRSRGVRICEPLLDPDLIQFLYDLSPRVLLRGGWTKWLARATLERRLPALAPRWPKAVYADRFWRSLMAREGPAAWRHLGGVSTLSELGLVDPDRFESAVESAFSTGDFPTTRQVWRTCMLEAWLRSGITPIIRASRD